MRQLTDIEALLLGIIRDKGESHGLEIGREAEARAKRWIGPGSLYRALHRMEDRGNLHGRWEGDDRDPHKGPPRRYYSISSLGAQALADYANSIAQKAQLPWLRPEAAK